MQRIEVDRLSSKLGHPPNMKALIKVLQILSQNGKMGKTSLSLYAHLNYNRLATIIDWLHERNLVELTSESDKGYVILTSSGRELLQFLQ